MSDQTIDVKAVLSDLKDFQRRTARWAFNRMFADDDPALRFLVADEVGLGKTHVAKGVVALVIDYLRRTGDERQDIVYVCSNSAIASQNVLKLTPDGVQPIQGVKRLTMLPLVELDEGDETRTGINLVAITPGTSLQFGRRTGTRYERALAYTFLRILWGREVMTRPARRVFWQGLSAGDPDKRLKEWERRYRPAIVGSLEEFAERLTEADRVRVSAGQLTLREVFDELVDGLAWKRKIPDDLNERRKELIGEVRRVMALVGLDTLRPDFVVLDEFQRFKDLLQSESESLAVELAQQLFNYRDPKTHMLTRTLLLSATPYRMYTAADEIEGDHYRDFLATCSFLFNDKARVGQLEHHFRALRTALTSTGSLDQAEMCCHDIAAELCSVMARTERLAATPNRDGMLDETDAVATVQPDDLRAYVRIGRLAEAVQHHEPTEYWKSAPYLVNFMEAYQFKQAVKRDAEDGLLGEELAPGPGLLSWDDVEAYEQVDPQNARLRWLLDDLHDHRAFELLWIPPSLRYYDTGSVYESADAAGFTKRLLFSGWTVVPKVVSSLVSFEAERRAFAGRDHGYTADYARRGGRRLALRTSKRAAAEPRPEEGSGRRRAAAMTAFVLMWPSPSLAELGDPRPMAREKRLRVAEALAMVEARVTDAIQPLVQAAPAVGPIDQRWYWAAPLLLDWQFHQSTTDLLLALGATEYWEDDERVRGLRAHLREARLMIRQHRSDLGRPPGDLARVLAELALGGPAQCALRSIGAVVGLSVSHEVAVVNAAWAAAAFRNFFNAPEVTAVVARGRDEDAGDDSEPSYWRDVLRHCIDGSLQAVLDEHAHVLRDWLGYLNLTDADQRQAAADDIACKLRNALDLRTSSYRVDVPARARDGRNMTFDSHGMRTRFAVAFGNQTLDEGGEARIESVLRAFNSPFWPFVLTSTSIGQEGLDFHLWCHAVVHWNLPFNPVDLEQREGRVHRYKGHAVRRNIAAILGPELRAAGLAAGVDIWDELFAMAAARESGDGSEMVPYWVFNQGPAKIERHVPVLPFSREAAALPRLRKTLAAYRLAFGQPRQEELVEFLGENFSEEELIRLRIDLSPPEQQGSVNF